MMVGPRVSMGCRIQPEEYTVILDQIAIRDCLWVQAFLMVVMEKKYTHHQTLKYSLQQQLSRFLSYQGHPHHFPSITIMTHIILEDLRVIQIQAIMIHADIQVRDLTIKIVYDSKCQV